MTDAPRPSSTRAEPHTDELVMARRLGPITHLTLNRPRALNALTRDMVARVHQGVLAAAEDGTTAVLLDGAGDRGFCGGGDVKAMAGGLAAGLDFLRAEYRADYAVHTSQVPVIGIMDGITMGGGIGLAAHAAIRVVTERTVLAMPETRIGIVPDVGGNLLLAAAPGRVGDLLAISSGTFSGADAIALGFADHFVPSERLGQLRDRLAAGEAVRDALAAVETPAPESRLVADHAWFTALVEQVLPSHEAVVAEPVAATSKLLAALEASGDERAGDLARAVRAVCPTSVVVALAQLARTRALRLDLAQVLADDFRTLGRLMGRCDFREGVRAQLIDKDRAPKWSPASIETVDAQAVASILDSAPAAGETPLGLGLGVDLDLDRDLDLGAAPPTHSFEG